LLSIIWFEQDPTFRPMGVGVSFRNTVPAVTHVLLAPVSGCMKFSGSSLSSSSSKNASNLFLVSICFGFAASNFV
jgi:hypothetical protein